MFSFKQQSGRNEVSVHDNYVSYKRLVNSYAEAEGYFWAMENSARECPILKYTIAPIFGVFRLISMRNSIKYETKLDEFWDEISSNEKKR